MYVILHCKYYFSFVLQRVHVWLPVPGEIAALPGASFMSTSHDQNFKNLIIDYPRQALAFFAPIEAASLPSDVKIIYIRQELPKDRLGDRFFEMDVPLLVEWLNGQREALLFIVEEETKHEQACTIWENYKIPFEWKYNESI